MSAHSPLLASLALLSLAGAGMAGTLRVPSQYATIQEAVDASASGDTIRVAPGTYDESVLLFLRDDVVLRGQQATLRELEVDFCNRATVRGFRFESETSTGIVISNCTEVTVKRCRFKSTTRGITTLDSTNVTIERNRFDSLAGTAIVLGDTNSELSEAGTVRFNLIRNPGGHGILVRGERNTVGRNTIRSAEGVGIGIAEDAADVSGSNVFFRNLVKDSGSDGIALYGSNNVVKKNRILGAVSDGVDIGGSSNTCERNIIRRSVDDGIELDLDSGNCWLERNRVRNSGSQGVLVLTTDNTLIKNRATGSASFDLLDLTDGQNTYQDNTFPKKNIDI